MKHMLVVLIGLSLMITTHALDFKENIHTYGKSEIFASTNTADAADSIGGIGSQDYTRVLQKGEDHTRLASMYSYKKDPNMSLALYVERANNASRTIFSNRSNSYQAIMTSPGGMQHDISVTSSESIQANNIIERTGNDISTKYEISSDRGNLTEGLSEINSINGHRHVLATTLIQGNFNLNSSLSQKEEVSRGFDLDDLKANMESVKVNGEQGVFEDRTQQPQIVIVAGQPASAEDAAYSYYLKGYKYEESGNYSDALTYFEKALASYDKNPEIWNEDGFTLSQLNRPAEADKAFDEALKLDPKYLVAIKNRAKNDITLERYDYAINLSDDYIKQDPTNADVWYIKGYSLFRLKMYHDAIVSFDKTTQIKPMYSDAWYSEGRAFYELAMYNESLASFERVLKLNINDSGALNQKGLVLLKLNKYHDAIEAFDKASKDATIAPEAWYNKYLALSAQNLNEAAEVAKQKAIELGYVPQQ